MRARSWSRAVVGLIGCGAALSAQVFTVDAAGGAGAHFTNLATAVATVPDGSTLRVRAGRYAGFAIVGKGLAVVGEGLVEIVVPAAAPRAVSVSQTAPSQLVLLRNLVVWGTFADPAGAILVDRAAGGVVLELILAMGVFGVVGLDVRASANVQVHRCQFAFGQPLNLTRVPGRIRVTDSTLRVSGSDVTGYDRERPSMVTNYPGDEGGPALEALRSRVELVDVRLYGGVGSPGCNDTRLYRCGTALPGRGGSGAKLDTSRLVVLRSRIDAADGAAAYVDISGPVPPGHGGDCVQARSGSSVVVRGSTLRPGLGGGSGGVSGVVAVVDASSSLSITAAQPTSGEIQGPQESGRWLDFVARGAPASPVVLLLSYSSALVPIEPLADGSLLASPAMTLGPYGIAPNGELRAPVTLPTPWPLGETYAAQFVSLEPGLNTIWLGNSMPLHLNH